MNLMSVLSTGSLHTCPQGTTHVTGLLGSDVMVVNRVFAHLSTRDCGTVPQGSGIAVVHRSCITVVHGVFMQLSTMYFCTSPHGSGIVVVLMLFVYLGFFPKFLKATYCHRGLAG